MSETKLISISELVSSGWTQFLKDWRRLFEISIRFVLAAVISLIAALIAERVPMASAVSYTILVIANALSIVIVLHTLISLLDYQLKRETNADAEITPNAKRAWGLLLSVLWIGILNLLIFAGGLLAFVLPGLWLSLSLSFGILFLIDEDRRGTQALAASAALVKGRWWPTLGRVLVPAILVVILDMLLSFIIMFILGMLIGFDRLSIFTNQAQPLQTASATIAGIQNVLGSLVQIALIPLSIIYQVKVYHSLKATR